MITIKRVYDPPDKSDGYRILVDRLWPRGLTKEKARADLWLKDIAPSNSLRQWFSHDPKKWPEFKKRYFSELETKDSLVETIKKKSLKNPVTLIYGAKDTEHNDAVALKEYLEKSR